MLATKVRFGPGLHHRGLGRKHILRSVDESLRRLRTDHIDLYQIHMWDYATPIEETLRTLDRLATSSKVRYLGISNVTGWQLQRTADICLGRPGVTAPILGVRSMPQLADNLVAVGWELDPADRSRLDEASRQRMPYPYALLEDLRDV